MKFGALALAAAVSVIAAPAAHAAHVISFDGTSGTFGNATVPGGAFTNTFNFNLPQPGTLSLTISSSRTSATNNIDFTSVTINGTPFQIGATGIVEFRFLNDLAAMAGGQTLVVSGRSGGNASYSGTITFSPNAVPEPATWAMMIGGFGLAGYALRRRPAPATA